MATYAGLKFFSWTQRTFAAYSKRPDHSYTAQHATLARLSVTINQPQRLLLRAQTSNSIKGRLGSREQRLMILKGSQTGLRSLTLTNRLKTVDRQDSILTEEST